MRRIVSQLAVFGASALVGCKSSSSSNKSSDVRASASVAMTDTASPSGSAASGDADEATLTRFFDTMHDRLLARAEAMRSKHYKSRVGYATDLALLTPDAMLSDARANPSAYADAGAASHLLAARADLREAAIDRYMQSISDPIQGLTRDLGAKTASLPKTDESDCLDALRIGVDDHSLGPALGGVIADCAGVLSHDAMKCANEAATRAEFDKCIASRSATSSATPSARPSAAVR